MNWRLLWRDVLNLILLPTILDQAKVSPCEWAWMEMLRTRRYRVAK